MMACLSGYVILSADEAGEPEQLRLDGGVG